MLLKLSNMSLKNTRSKLLAEFKTIEKGKNPRLDRSIEAIVVLSGESLDPKIKTDLLDTETRLLAGIKIYRKIEKLGGKPVLVINGTDDQNRTMVNVAKESGITNIEQVKNPPYPKASTLTQIKGLRSLNFKKILLVNHAEGGPRTARYTKKLLQNSCKCELYLINRKRMSREQIDEEIGKIIKYSVEGDLSLF